MDKQELDRLNERLGKLKCMREKLLNKLVLAEGLNIDWENRRQLRETQKN